MNVVQLVKDGKAKFEWAEVISEYHGHKLHLSVLEDDRLFNGVRLPATAHELQEIADLIGGMLLTPKVIDLIWLQAKIKFDAVVNSGPPSYDIVANMDIHKVHELIEAKVAEIGDDGMGLISCVGKYWCLIEQLTVHGMLHGDWTACNYGWFAKKASGAGLSPGPEPDHPAHVPPGPVGPGGRDRRRRRPSHHRC
jgi:hypothetical protein